MNVAHKANDPIREMNKVVEKLEGAHPTFYYSKIDSKGNEKWSIVVAKLLEFLIKEGFWRYLGGYIRVTDNKAELTDEKAMYQTALAYVVGFQDTALTSDFIQRGASLLLNQKGTVLALKEFEGEFLRDMRGKAHLPFRNTVLIVTKDGIEQKSYSEIDSIIWRTKIIEREFVPVSKSEANSCMFNKFTLNVAGDNENQFVLMRTIGRLLHGFKSSINVKAQVINDMSTNPDGSPAGGTGKGIILDAVDQMVEVLKIDGKRLNMKTDKFALQNVKLTTDVIYIDDAAKNFDLEDFFSSQTGGMEIERKGKDKTIIPFKDSPQLALTTNYGLKGLGSSHKRRKHEVYLTSYYSHEHTPYDDFKCEFFHGWEEKEFNLFDNWMVLCIQQYMNNGLTIYDTEATRKAALIKQIGTEFWDAMDNGFGNPGVSYPKGSLKERLATDNPILRNISYKKIKSYLDLYANFKGYSILHSGKSTGGRFYYVLHEMDENGRPIKSENQSDF